MSAAATSAELAALRAAAGADTRPEFAFSAGDFERARKLIHQHAGISLHAGKQAMVYSRLSRRLRETRRHSFSDYLQNLQGLPPSDPEWQEFVNALTTNLTSFFRENHHFEVLAEELKSRSRQQASWRVWCNAASTGEEPYSIAMTCAEALGPSAAVQVLASDIDTRVLASAARGIYPAETRGLSPARLRMHFLRGKGANEGAIRIKPELARRVEFCAHNLIDTHWSLGAPFDIVFCRNVMIYFDGPTQRQVLERIHRVMKPHGLLFVGHSENFTEAKDLFRLRGQTVYERV